MYQPYPYVSYHHHRPTTLPPYSDRYWMSSPPVYRGIISYSDDTLSELGQRLQSDISGDSTDQLVDTRPNYSAITEGRWE